MIFYDTETIGYHGPIILLQWAEDDGPVHLHEVWRVPIQDTLDIIRRIVEHTGPTVGFNLTFDWFHLCQSYTTLLLLRDAVGGDAIPEDHIDLYAVCEEQARIGPCLKPQAPCDLMLHARKGPYQSTMNRGDVRIRRVPTGIAHLLAEELGKRITFSDIHFARFKDPKRRWMIYDIKNDLGEIMPAFKDVVLKFNPSSALKALAVDAGLTDSASEVLLFDDVNISKRYPVEEMGYAPFAMAIGKPGGYGSWNGAWPQVIKLHIAHWAFDANARKYATDDVLYTRGLYYHLDEPEAGDNDSVLACMVGAVRWSGFALDIPALTALHNKTVEDLAEIPYNFASTKVTRTYLEQVLSDTEVLVIRESTKKIILLELAKWTLGDVCEECGGLGVLMTTKTQHGEVVCENCEEGEVPNPDKPHPVQVRARMILDFRRLQNERKLYEKLIKAGRFHVDANVIGTLSSRMSGAGGVNAQGINSQYEVRRCFPLADGVFTLCGGDFAGFEMTIGDAVYDDPQLREDLLSRRGCKKCKCRGTIGIVTSPWEKTCGCQDCDAECSVESKIHASFGVNFFPGMSYEDILATKGMDQEHDKYNKSKAGLFAVMYFGEAYTLMNRIGVSEEAAMKGYELFLERYPVLSSKREKARRAFCPVSQIDGIGTKPAWQRDPDEYVESMFGFRRYFTLENQVLVALWDICQKPPVDWNMVKTIVVRRDREQSSVNATRSALLGALFGLQGSNMRAAGNHWIQSAGATITKELQTRLWDLQPCGIMEFVIKTLNIHDELMTPVIRELIVEVECIVEAFKLEYRAFIPLLDIEWGSNLKSWAEK